MMAGMMCIVEGISFDVTITVDTDIDYYLTWMNV